MGKGQRVRTVPIPAWVKLLIDRWIAVAGFDSGPLFRSVNKGDAVSQTDLTENAVRNGGLILSAPSLSRRYASSHESTPSEYRLTLSTMEIPIFCYKSQVTVNRVHWRMRDHIGTHTQEAIDPVWDVLPVNDFCVKVVRTVLSKIENIGIPLTNGL